VFDSVVAANRVAFAAFGVGSSVGEENQSGTETDGIEADGDLSEWHTEVVDGDEFGVGDRVEFTKTISEEDLRRFAAASGDTNPLHLDEEFAQGTRFRGRIAHGTLVGGLISAALARVPGLVIYLSQDMEFHNPVRVDDRVTAECEVVEGLGNDQFRLSTRVRNDGDVAIDGEAVVMIDDPPE
jgi:acyl dehydratase